MPVTPTPSLVPTTHPNETTGWAFRRDSPAKPVHQGKAKLKSLEYDAAFACPPVQNRVRVLLVHIPRLSIRGQARLAAEVGVSRSTISRLVNHQINPSYRLAHSVTSVLERLLGHPLDMREVFSTDGTYLTPSGCKLCGCGGCLPDAAYDQEGHLLPEWRDARPGVWSLAPEPLVTSPIKEGT